MSADGTRIAWSSSEHGDGSRRPLVLIGGWAQCSGDWDVVRSQLSAGRQVVQFDPRGTGASEGDESSAFDVGTLAEDALAVARSAAFSASAPVDVLGFSLGGLVAQELVMRAPSEVRKVVLASTSPGGADLKGLISRDYFDVLDTWEDEDGTTSSEIARRRAAAAYFVHGLPEKYVQDRVEELKDLITDFVDAAKTGRRVAATIQAQKKSLLSPFPAASRFKDLAAPKEVLVLHGDLDPVIDPFCAMKLAQMIPRAKLLLLSGIGHHAFLQEPDAWANTVTDFLDDVQRDQPPPPTFDFPTQQ